MFRMAECDGSVFYGNLCSIIPRTVYAAWPCGVLRRADAHFPQLFGKNAATHALATLLARAICCAGWGERRFIAEPRRIGRVSLSAGQGGSVAQQLPLNTDFFTAARVRVAACFTPASSDDGASGGKTIGMFARCQPTARPRRPALPAPGPLRGNLVGNQKCPAVHPCVARPCVGAGLNHPTRLLIIPHRSRTAAAQARPCKRPCRASLTRRVQMPATERGELSLDFLCQFT